MKAWLRALLVALCLALPWIVQSLAPSSGRMGWDWTNGRRPAAGQGTGARIVETDPRSRFDRVFVPVPETVWTDRDVPLPADSLRAMLDELEAAGLTRDDISSERSRLEGWLDAHRAGSVLDLPGAWHGALRLVDSEADREYEVNRRKRKLLGRVLAALED